MKRSVVAKQLLKKSCKVGSSQKLELSKTSWEGIWIIQVLTDLKNVWKLDEKNNNLLISNKTISSEWMVE